MSGEGFGLFKSAPTFTTEWHFKRVENGGRKVKREEEGKKSLYASQLRGNDPVVCDQPLITQSKYSGVQS
jgi:hypothetical protein